MNNNIISRVVRVSMLLATMWKCHNLTVKIYQIYQFSSFLTDPRHGVVTFYFSSHNSVPVRKKVDCVSEKKTFDSSLIYWSAWVVSHRRCQVLSSSCYRPVFARVHRQLWWVMWLHHHSGLVLGSTAVYTARPRYSFTVPSISTRSKKLRQKLSVVGLSVELIWHKCRHDALDIFLSRYIPWRTVGSIAQHHSIRWWSVYRAVSPMTVCSVPERTERLHGRPSVTDMDIRSSTRAITDRRQFIVSAQQKHSNNIWLLQLTPLSSRGAKIAISHKRLDTYRYYVCMYAREHISKTRPPNFNRFCCLLPAAMARSFSDSNVLPVLWLMPCFHKKPGVCFSTAQNDSPGGSTVGEVWCLWMPC